MNTEARRVRASWENSQRSLKFGQGESLCQFLLWFRERGDLLSSEQYEFISRLVIFCSLVTSGTICWDLVVKGIFWMVWTIKHLSEGDIYEKKKNKDEWLEQLNPVSGFRGQPVEISRCWAWSICRWWSEESSGNPSVFLVAVCIISGDGTDIGVVVMFVSWRRAWTHPASAHRASLESPSKDLGSWVLVLSDSKSRGWEKNWKHSFEEL